MKAEKCENAKYKKNAMQKFNLITKLCLKIPGITLRPDPRRVRYISFYDQHSFFYVIRPRWRDRLLFVPFENFNVLRYWFKLFLKKNA